MVSFKKKQTLAGVGIAVIAINKIAY